MKRSQELRQVLIEDLSIRDIIAAYRERKGREKMRDSHEGLERCKQAYEQEKQTIRDIANQVTELKARVDILDDREFEERYSDIEQTFRACLDRISARGWPSGYDAIDWNDIRSLKDYVEHYPIHFMPRKEEIGRILSIARQVHDMRVAKGEISSDEPITIIDVGGGNGALAKLITDLATDNILPIRCIVVDPDADIAEKAKNILKNDQNISFVTTTAQEYSIEHTPPDISKLILERAALISHYRRELHDLRILCQRLTDRISKPSFTLNDTAFQSDIRVLRDSFHEDISGEHDQEDLRDILNPYPHPRFDEQAVICRFLENAQRDIRLRTVQIERILALRPAQCDLVMNTYMPYNVDFTGDIYALNGAAVYFVSATGGATGIEQSHSGSLLPGEDISYRKSTNYTDHGGWFGPTNEGINEVLLKLHSAITTQNKHSIRIKGRYSPINSHIDYSPHAGGIAVEGTYPWEQELDAMMYSELEDIEKV